MISQGKKVIEERLQRKREQCIHQKEKLEQMKCTMRKTEEEVEQLEYVLHEIEHIEKSKREPDRKSTRLNSSHANESRMPSSA